MGSGPDEVSKQMQNPTHTHPVRAQEWDYRYAVSIVTWVGMPFAAAAGWALAVWRFSYFARLLEVFRRALEQHDGKVTDVSRVCDAAITGLRMPAVAPPPPPAWQS